MSAQDSRSTEERFYCYEKDHPVCPHCFDEMDLEDMVELSHGPGGCVFALAKDEDRMKIKCISCKKDYWLKGGYSPHYTSAIDEDDL